jgi:hypothetical protein
VHSQQRVFVFEAESRAQMLEWIKALEDSMKAAKELLLRETKAKEVASLPFRIRVRSLSPLPPPSPPLLLALIALLTAL